MEITYLGDYSFKLKGKRASLITDPVILKGGSGQTADLVTLSSASADRKAAEKVLGTARRDKPYLISAPGEYEVSGVGVFGWRDTKENTLYTIHIDGVSVGHLGRLTEVLGDDMTENLGLIDILLLSINLNLINPLEKLTQIIAAIQPSYVVPMDYTPEGLNLFTKEMGGQAKILDSLNITGGTQADETEVVVLKPKE